MGILSYLISLLIIGAFGYFLRAQVKKVDSLHVDKWNGRTPYRDCFNVADFGLYRNTMTGDPDIPLLSVLFSPTFASHCNDYCCDDYQDDHSYDYECDDNRSRGILDPDVLAEVNERLDGIIDDLKEQLYGPGTTYRRGGGGDFSSDCGGDFYDWGSEFGYGDYGYDDDGDE